MEINKKKLADYIIEELKEEFAIKHMSKNLIDTIQLIDDGKEIRIEIPAKTYNMLTFQREGVIVHTSHGSYAAKLDEEGSNFYIYRNKQSRRGSFRTYPGNHKGYVNKVINKALNRFLAEEKLKVDKMEEFNGD